MGHRLQLSASQLYRELSAVRMDIHLLVQSHNCATKLLQLWWGIEIAHNILRPGNVSGISQMILFKYFMDDFVLDDKS